MVLAPSLDVSCGESNAAVIFLFHVVLLPCPMLGRKMSSIVAVQARLSTDPCGLLDLVIRRGRGYAETFAMSFDVWVPGAVVLATLRQLRSVLPRCTQRNRQE